MASTATTHAPDHSRMRRPLLRWYEREKRDLPWRRTRDPYRIWVAEIMLQQTRVEAVKGYYREFLRRFPTVAALARAPEERVLAAWSGLGYYLRARNLLRAARQIVSAHGGKFPRDPDAALALPGVGRYTAGAVLSIAYGSALPVLDGNVARVLARLGKLQADVRDAKGKALLWDVAAKALDTRRPGDFNQAMMELGATVCVPGVPRCEACPLREQCLAYADGSQFIYPPRPRRHAEERLHLTAAVVADRAGRVLLERRDSGAAWMPGFWQIPTWQSNETAPVVWRQDSGIRDLVAVGGKLGTVRHSITKYRIEVEIREAALNARRSLAESAAVRWASLSEVRRLPVTTITAKALKLWPSRR